MRVFCFIGDEILAKIAKSIANQASIQAAVGPVVLNGVVGYTAKISSQYILFFDLAAAPADGAVPEFMLLVQASSIFTIDFGFHGYEFKNGLYICNSSTQQTKTIGSADCWFNVQMRSSI